MVLLENIKHRLQNVPGFLKAKIKGDPFHWTMTRKQLENRTKIFENMLQFRKEQAEKKKLRNEACQSFHEQVKSGTPLTRHDELYVREYCLIPENTNAEEVNINRINTETRNLNLPIKDPLIEARKKLEIVYSYIDQLNPYFEAGNALSYSMNKRQYFEEHQAKLKDLITKAEIVLKDIIINIRGIKGATYATEAKDMLRMAKFLQLNFDALRKDIDKKRTYSKQQARNNLKLATKRLKQNNYKNMSQASHTLKNNPTVNNITVLGEFGEALQNYYTRGRRQRVLKASRNKTVNNKTMNWGTRRH